MSPTTTTDASTTKSTLNPNNEDENNNNNAPSSSPSPALPLPQRDKIVHPMIPVPHAIRLVLRETASMLQQQQHCVPPNNITNNDKDTTEDDDIPEDEHTEVIPVRDDTSSNSSDTPPPSSPSSSCARSSLIGRISAQHITAPHPGYPTYNASVMDGYAIHLEPCLPPTEESVRFRLADRVFAGDRPHSSIPPSNASSKNDPIAIYITTGAAIPPPFNTVIPLEQTTPSPPSTITIPATTLQSYTSPTANRWIRPIGCDIPPSTPILHPSQTIDVPHIGLLLQCNIPEVRVKRRPVVGVLSTGHELLPDRDSGRQGGEDRLGMIPDVNRPTLLSLLQSYQSCATVDLGIVHDDSAVDGVRDVLLEAVGRCDVVITTGGISEGDADVVEEALRCVGVEGGGGRIVFGRLCMKPGKPTTFASLPRPQRGGAGGGRCLVFAMPGNPVSAYVCTDLLVRPCLDLIHRYTHHNPTTTPNKPPPSINTLIQNATVHAELNATLSHSIPLDVQRPEYHRVALSYHAPSSTFRATSTGTQRSSRLASMDGADGVLVLPQGERGGRRVAEEGEVFTVLLFRPLFGGGGGSGSGGVRWGDSVHRRSARLAVGLVLVGGGREEEEGLVKKIQESFGGINAASVVQTVALADEEGGDGGDGVDLESALPRVLEDDVRLSPCLDVILVLCRRRRRPNGGGGDDGGSGGGTFRRDLDVAKVLRGVVTKEAEGMAMEIRRGAAGECGVAALFEPVVGYYTANNDNRSGDDGGGDGGGVGKECLLLSVPEDGLVGALGRVKDLLRRALSLARDDRVGG